MNAFSFVHCFAFWAYLFLSVFVLTKNPKSPVNRSCSLLLMYFAIWSFGILFVHNTDVPKSTAWFAMSMYSISWIGFSSIFLFFALIFSGKTYLFKNPLLYLFGVLPTLFLIYKQWTGHLIVDFVLMPYGWSTIWSRSFWFYFHCNYYTAIMLVSLYFIFDYWKKTPELIEKKQSKIILLCTLVPLTLGSFTDVFLPLLNIRVIPNMANVLGLVWGVGLVYAIVKYKLMVLTPAMAADDIISTMEDSLVLISPESKILIANRYTFDLLGYEKRELLDKPVETIISGDKEESPFYGAKLKNMKKTGIIKDLTISYKKNNGEKVQVSFSGSVMKDNNANIIGIVGIARDMRELNRLAAKEKELAIALAVTKAEYERSEELKKAYDELKKTQAMLIQSEKLRALGQLGAGVAHELNSPLAGMLCLMRSYMKKKDPESREYKDLAEMEEGCEFMAKIISDLSEFTKESPGNFTKTNLENVIEATIVLVLPQLKRKNINVEKSFAKDTPLVMGERRQLQQVVINMITNARDAMEQGGNLKISTKRIEDSGKIYAEMSFEDTGCGMSDEVKKRIFEHFFTTKKEEHGVGLGLAIVNSIVDLHNGKIKVTSEIGKGTVFTIRLPGVI